MRNGKSPARARRECFGVLADGREVAAVVLDSGNGVTARVITLGASLQSLVVPDRDGIGANVVLGHPGPEGYLDNRHYLGCTVGRCANRIAGARFPLDGRNHVVSANAGRHSLHGGSQGFDQALWTIVAIEADETTASVRLRHISPDGDMGYPGELVVTATWTLDTGNRLVIDYRATCDRPTIVNLTHHAYWNLAGEGSEGALDAELRIAADTWLPVDAESIPTGELRSVAGSAFDFRVAKAIARDIAADDEQLRVGHGYDHCFVVGSGIGDRARFVAQADDRRSGRRLTVHSNQPGLQLYTGNHFDGDVIGTSGRAYGRNAGFALEPQLFPDTPNRGEFGCARLVPGEEYRNLIVYAFDQEG